MLSEDERPGMTDEQLVSYCLKGDAAAQKRLYEKFASRMFGVCLRYAASREEAEDVLQEGFLKVFTHLSSYKGSGVLEGWIRKVIINTALTAIRENRQAVETLEDTEEPSIDAAVIPDLNAKDLLVLIQALPPGFRTVFNLYAIEGYSHREIADLLGISENTSKSQYARARAQLADRIRSVHAKS